jgi:hypothetical protein
MTSIEQQKRATARAKLMRDVYDAVVGGVIIGAVAVALVVFLMPDYGSWQ